MNTIERNNDDSKNLMKALENIKEAIQLVFKVSQEEARSYAEVLRVEVACA